METAVQKQTVAVIDIGSSGIRMIIAEVGTKSEIRYLENVQKPIPLGRDVFSTGRISSAVMRESLAILKNYKSLLEEYGIKKVQVVATSAVREAANRENFIDQIFVRTGMDVEVLEGAEENRLELIAVEHALGEQFEFAKKSCLIVEVGAGSTEMIILNKGEVELTRLLPIGSLRLPEQVVPGKTDSAVMQRVLKRSIREIAQYAGREYNLGDIDTFIAVGSEMRFVARQLMPNLEGDSVVIEGKAFVNFVSTISKMFPEELVGRFGLPYNDAQTLYPTLLFYSYFLAETKSEQVIVPMVSIRDGLLLELSQILSGYKRTDVSRQVVASAKKLARKYKYDEAHSLLIASLALKFFDLFKDDHGLGSRERLLLEVSGILHDIGMYIAQTSHHKHSSYLIEASEIFGLRKIDKEVVSNVVRYHRRAVPQITHEPYMSLPKNERAVVTKLAAMLRAADSLDRSHQQKIRNFTLEREDDACVLWVPEDAGDISIERDGLAKKSGLFTEVFGMTLTLKQGTPKA